MYCVCVLGKGQASGNPIIPIIKFIVFIVVVNDQNMHWKKHEYNESTSILVVVHSGMGIEYTITVYLP